MKSNQIKSAQEKPPHRISSFSFISPIAKTEFLKRNFLVPPIKMLDVFFSLFFGVWRLLFLFFWGDISLNACSLCVGSFFIHFIVWCVVGSVFIYLQLDIKLH